jgi:tRNA pseudouridine32 synthase/23S rRNA pseudouridine746 synthase
LLFLCDLKSLVPLAVLHSFTNDVSHIRIPARFTFPFYYEPHQLALEASNELKKHLDEMEDWFFDLKLGPKEYQHPKGKMFGVLVVKDAQGTLGHLWAYSGVITGKQESSRFVPLLFNMFEENGRYSKENKRLDAINASITIMETDAEFMKRRELLRQKDTINLQLLEELKKKHQEQKRSRRATRADFKKQLIPQEFEELSDQHGYQSMQAKFMQKEYAIYLKNKTSSLRKEVEQQEKKIAALKNERKELSNDLQNWIFQQYSFLNIDGERKNALDIFKNIPPYFPPSGTGDCAAPKLLQYAFLNDLEPIVMAEFWYGESLKSQVRQHGNFYPSCRSKCEPILQHMLQGLDVDKNPLLEHPGVEKKLEIIYQDEHLLAVNKPADFLSVPGKTITDSVQQRMRQLFPDATGPLLVHRLDMSTSGILLVALHKDVHQQLQEQFIKRTVSKQYVALLNGIIEKPTGFIDLPLGVDLDNRPYQLVDPVYGKNARTRYEVVEIKDGKTRVHFYPITGRTHQLRVHAAHHDGLSCPIVGDDLYGTTASRLHLHAARLTFTHPATQETIELYVPAPF